MGAWDYGLFDNDGALDTVGGLADWLRGTIGEMASEYPREERAGELAAAIGLLLQFSDYDISSGEGLPWMIPSIYRHQAHFDALPERAVEVLETIAEGDGEELTERRGERPPELLAIVGGYLNSVREPDCFIHPSSRMLTQHWAAHCGDALDKALEGAKDAGMHSLLAAFGIVGVLLLTEPLHLDSERIAGWESAIDALISARMESGHPDIEFYEEVFERARKAFPMLLSRAKPLMGAA